MEAIAKPRELLDARTAAAALFGLLRDWFDVPERVTLDLRDVDVVGAQLNDPRVVMALAMRRLQVLHRLATPGVRTTSDVVLMVLQDVERALLQAPGLHLRTEAARADWDAELAGLADASADASEDDLERLHRHRASLRAAAKAVLHASDGRVLVLL